MNMCLCVNVNCSRSCRHIRTPLKRKQDICIKNLSCLSALPLLHYRESYRSHGHVAFKVGPWRTHLDYVIRDHRERVDVDGSAVRLAHVNLIRDRVLSWLWLPSAVNLTSLQTSRFIPACSTLRISTLPEKTHLGGHKPRASCKASQV